MVREREDSLRILGWCLLRIDLCITRAWRDLDEVPAKIRSDMSPRTRAAFVNDRTILHARREFENDRRVAFIRGKGGLFVLGICEAFLLRFKKLKPSLRSSNIPTQQAMAFAQQGELENMPPASTHINAGYILNRMQTEIAAKFVTCPVGKRLEWVIDLTAVSQGEVVPMTPQPGQPKTRTTIVPKVTPAPKRTEESSGREDGGNGDDDRDGKS
jgi:hypothetical protein